MKAKPRPLGPIRLKVGYKDPEMLVGEYTRSVGQGMVSIDSGKSLPIGTKFVFELWSKGLDRPVEVSGEVFQVTEAAPGRFRLHIRYGATGDQRGLDQALQKVFDNCEFDKVRKNPRVPIRMRATEDVPYSPSYVIRDMSLGGMGVEVETPNLPQVIRVGAPFKCELKLAVDFLDLHGEIVWVSQPPPETDKALNPAFGVKFGELTEESMRRLEGLLSLKNLPPAPWKVRFRFGENALPANLIVVDD